MCRTNKQRQLAVHALTGGIAKSNSTTPLSGWVSVSTPPAGGQVTNTNSPVVTAAASATTSGVVTAASPVVATGNPAREYETAEAYYSYIVEQDRQRHAAQQIMQHLGRTATIATEAPLSRASTLNTSRSGESASAAAALVGNGMPRVVSRPPPGLEGEVRFHVVDVGVNII